METLRPEETLRWVRTLMSGGKRAPQSLCRGDQSAERGWCPGNSGQERATRATASRSNGFARISGPGPHASRSSSMLSWPARSTRRVSGQSRRISATTSAALPGAEETATNAIENLIWCSHLDASAQVDTTSTPSPSASSARRSAHRPSSVSSKTSANDCGLAMDMQRGLRSVDPRLYSSAVPGSQNGKPLVRRTYRSVPGVFGLSRPGQMAHR